ncbi:kinase-like protein [Xylaria sp. FL0933]|nr:kinase-like protein [Xylaria sp. FL0933]
MASSSRHSLGNSSQYSDSLSDLSRQTSGQSSRGSITSSYDSAEHDLYDQLDERILECDESRESQAFSHFKFLPRDALDKVITTDVVKGQLPLLDSSDSARFSKTVEGAKKVLAVLGLCGIEDLFWSLVREGLTDKDLPLVRQGAEKHCQILESSQGKVFKSLSAKRHRIAVENFLQKQWQVLAPVFTRMGEDIKIDGNVALPFYDVKKKSALNNKSTVYKGIIHAAHRGPELRNIAEVAIKDYTEKEDFVMEKNNLLKIQSLKKKHLIRHVAAIEQGNSFYVIFRWANGGTLLDFWKGDPTAVPTRDRQLFVWCLQQMLGLVDALFALHDKNCRHGDLKPENILHFKDSTGIGEFGTLVIADVGISKFHTLATEHRHDPTNTKATTPCYEAPEAVTDRKKPRGRRYDMWSVGCMFMEFTIWLLYGYEAIRNFEERRRENDDPFPHKAPYYESTGPHTAIVHPVVSHGLKALENDPRCAKGTGLASLVSLIGKDLIVVEPEKRLQAGKLKDRLRGIVERAGKDPCYLMKRYEPPPKIPVPFTPGKCGDGNG